MAQNHDRSGARQRAEDLARLVTDRSDWARLAAVEVVSAAGPKHWGVAVIIDEGYDAPGVADMPAFYAALAERLVTAVQ
jgi:hypothetical protein